MCIIVIKEKNKPIPKKEIIKNCFENNPNGAGFMYANKGRVIIEKGFFEVEQLYNRLVNLDKKINLKNRNLVLHFRIATSGNVDGKTCHPFPISSSQSELQATNIKCKLAMVHNGIISNYAYKNSNLSDTQNFVKDFVTPLYYLNNNFLKFDTIQNMLEKEANNTRLCFLDNKDNLLYLGNFTKDNYIYSNDSYKKRSYKWSYTPKYDLWDYYKNYNKEDTKNIWDYKFSIEDDTINWLDETSQYYDSYKKEYVMCSAEMFEKDNKLYECYDYDTTNIYCYLLEDVAIIKNSARV